MKKCNHCGEENKDESKFCHDCGSKLDSPKPAVSSNKNLIDRFNNTNIIIKIIIILIAVFIFLVIVGWAGHIFFGMPLEAYTEGEQTSHSTEFYSLDMDDNGALSFDEVDGYAPDISPDDLSDIFDLADKNDNKFLIGAEFDGYIYNVEKYYKDLEKAEQEKSDSSSSNSNPSTQDEDHETCPVCGSDQLSEFYNAEYGEMDWQCDDCGEIIRSEDDLYINYWEEQGVKYILPSLESNLAITYRIR